MSDNRMARNRIFGVGHAVKSAEGTAALSDNIRYEGNDPFDRLISFRAPSTRWDDLVFNDDWRTIELHICSIYCYYLFYVEDYDGLK